MLADSRVIDLVAMWEELRERGSARTPEELCHHCPELLPSFRKALADLGLLDTALATSSADGDAQQSESIGEGDAIQLSAAFTHLRFHARGGLGEVLVGTDLGLGRRVALKRMSARAATRSDAVHRFLREARLTSRLDHPGIIPVHGIGRTPDGRPCYAMRFIQGRNLGEAIKEYHQLAARGTDGDTRLKFRQLIQSFVAACQAVAYAHSRGVLHRDLKPANIMLGPFGETLVIDWGLARFIASDGSRLESSPAAPAGEGGRDTADLKLAAGDTVDWMACTPEAGPGGELGGVTVDGQVIGSPAYMSPEQAAGKTDLGPASDQFGLGAILFEILTGRPPYQGNTLQAVLADAVKGAVPNPASFNRNVPAGLRAVCLKATAFAPADRYPDVSSLTADLERWLADEPVSCCREPASVRIARWCRKHRTIVSTVAAAVLIIAVGLGTVAAVLSGKNRELSKANADTEEALRLAMASDQQAQSAAKDARAAQRVAEQKEREAARFAEFLQGVFATSDPIGLDHQGFGPRRGPNTTARELLDAGLTKVKAEVTDARVRASLLESLGMVYGSLGSTKAEGLLKEALELRRIHWGERSEQYAGCQHALGKIYRDQGRFAEAELLLRQALSIRKKVLGPNDVRVASTQFHLAWTIAHRFEEVAPQRVNEAITLLNDSIRIHEQVPGSNPKETALARIALGLILQEQNNPVAKFASLGLLQKGFEQLGGKDRTGLLLRTYQKAIDERKAGRYSIAAGLHQQVYNAVLELVGERHPLSIFTLGAWAGALRDQALREEKDPVRLKALLHEAIGLGRKAVELARDSTLRWHPARADVLVELADITAAGGGAKGLREAEGYYREAHDVVRANGDRRRAETVRVRLVSILLIQEFWRRAGWGSG